MTKVSVVIPAYNEQNRLPRTLSSIAHFNSIMESRGFTSVDEVVVVDDGSTDKTVERIKRYKFPLNMKIVRKENGGKWSAIREGIKAASNDLVLVMDADNSASVWNMSKMIPKEGWAVFGSRFDDCSLVHGKSFVRQVVSKGYRIYVLFWYHLFCPVSVKNSIQDMQCPFKLFYRSDLVSELSVDQFAGDIDLAMKLDAKILSVPVEFIHNDDSRVTLKSSVKMLFETPKIAFKNRKCLKDSVWKNE